MIEFPAFRIGTPFFNFDPVFEAIEELASCCLVNFLKPVSDQPITHGLFETAALRHIAVKGAQHVGATSLQRLRNQQPVILATALAGHRLLAKAYDF